MTCVAPSSAWVRRNPDAVGSEHLGSPIVPSERHLPTGVASNSRHMLRVLLRWPGHFPAYPPEDMYRREAAPRPQGSTGHLADVVAAKVREERKRTGTHSPTRCKREARRRPSVRNAAVCVPSVVMSRAVHISDRPALRGAGGWVGAWAVGWCAASGLTSPLRAHAPPAGG